MCAAGFLLALDRLLDNIAHDDTQAARSVESDLERSRGEKRFDLLDPVCFDGVEIDPLSELVQEGHILPHVAETAAACPAAFRRQHALDPVPS